MSRPKPFCPHLTVGQVLTMGFVGQVVPIGEADVTPTPSTGLLQQGKLDLSNLGRKLPVYEAKLTAQIKGDEKTQAPVADAAMVNCQGPRCFFWCEAHETCGEVCHDCQAEALYKALKRVEAEALAPQGESSE